MSQPPLRTEAQRTRWRALLAARPGRAPELEARLWTLAGRMVELEDPWGAALDRVEEVERELEQVRAAGSTRRRWGRVLPVALAAGVLAGVLLPVGDPEEAGTRGPDDGPTEAPEGLRGDPALRLEGEGGPWPTPLGTGARFSVPWSASLRVVSGRAGLVAYRVGPEGIRDLDGRPGAVTPLEGPVAPGGPGVLVVAAFPETSDAAALATALRDGARYEGRPRQALLVAIDLEAP